MVDEVLYLFDRISSTQLYTLIVTLTVLVSVILLGSSSDIPTLPKPEIDIPRKKKKEDGVPEVRWQIFTYVNYAIVAAFMLSVMEFARNASNYYYHHNHALFQFLFGWSVFLCYFFGFFGISFVHQNLPDRYVHG